MDHDVMFYFLSGKGSITVDQDSESVIPGDCVIVPHEASTRSIKAETDMEILAVQGLKVLQSNTESIDT
jgi:mannose-6-phosphate isomerase-like protein (cupin superfamily)